jgi:hypothetical protein
LGRDVQPAANSFHRPEAALKGALSGHLVAESFVNGNVGDCEAFGVHMGCVMSVSCDEQARKKAGGPTLSGWTADRGACSVCVFTAP